MNMNVSDMEIVVRLVLSRMRKQSLTGYEAIVDTARKNNREPFLALIAVAHNVMQPDGWVHCVCVADKYRRCGRNLNNTIFITGSMQFYCMLQ